MSGNKCSYIDCGKASRNRLGFRKFRFPVNNPAKCKKWMINSGNYEKLSLLSPQKLQARFLCGDHFDSKYLFSRRMTPDAVPIKLENTFTTPPLKSYGRGSTHQVATSKRTTKLLQDPQSETTIKSEHPATVETSKSSHECTSVVLKEEKCLHDFETVLEAKPLDAYKLPIKSHIEELTQPDPTEIHIKEEVIEPYPEIHIKEEVIEPYPEVHIKEEVSESYPETHIKEEVIEPYPEIHIKDVIESYSETHIEEEVIDPCPETHIKEEVIEPYPIESCNMFVETKLKKEKIEIKEENVEFR